MYHTAAATAETCVRARSRFFGFFLHPHLLLLHARPFCVYLNERENASFSLGGHFLRINVILYTHVLFSCFFLHFNEGRWRARTARDRTVGYIPAAAHLYYK